MTSCNLPIIVIIHATIYEVRPIHTIHIINVMTDNFGYFLQSGVVMYKTNDIGHVTTHQIFPFLDSSEGHCHIFVDSSAINHTSSVKHLYNLRI